MSVQDSYPVDAALIAYAQNVIGDNAMTDAEDYIM